MTERKEQEPKLVLDVVIGVWTRKCWSEERREGNKPVDDYECERTDIDESLYALWWQT